MVEKGYTPGPGTVTVTNHYQHSRIHKRTDLNGNITPDLFFSVKNSLVGGERCDFLGNTRTTDELGVFQSI